MTREKPNKSHGVRYGCNSHDCVFGPPEGMGTNSTCKCLAYLPTKIRIAIERHLRKLNEVEE